MRVSDLMTREIFTCRENATLGDAVKLMWEHAIGFVPVVSASSDALVGVVTDRDAGLTAWLHDKRLREIPVCAAMSTRLVACNLDETIDDAELRMIEFQVRRLPVVATDGKLVGVISLDDVARHAARNADQELEEEVAVTLGAVCEQRPAQ